MWPDRVSNPGPLTYESGALLTALRGPATTERLYFYVRFCLTISKSFHYRCTWPYTRKKTVLSQYRASEEMAY